MCVQREGREWKTPPSDASPRRLLYTHTHTHTPDPGFMSEVQVDRGAIRFVLGGAHIMCPGLTSPGGKMEEKVEAEMPVVSRCR